MSLPIPARRPPRRSRAARCLPALLAAAAVTILLAGCEGQATGQRAGEADSPWPTTDHPVSRTGLVWARDDTVHLGDGSTIDTDEPIAGYVVAGDGIVYVPEGSSQVKVATPDGVDPTDAHADPSTLRVSPDGRFVAFLDLSTGDVGGGDTPLATLVIADLTTGHETVRTSHGMGDPDTDDLADLYEDAPPLVIGLTDATAYVDAANGEYHAYDLETGERTVAPDADGDLLHTDWYRQIDRPEAATNPAGTWTVANPFGRAPRLVPTTGRPVITRAPVDVWVLDSWLDDDTAVATASIADTGVVLLACNLPTGDCEPVPGTEDGVLLPSRGSAPLVVPEASEPS